MQQNDDLLLGELDKQIKRKLISKAVIRDGQQKKGEVEVMACMSKYNKVEEHVSKEFLGYKCSIVTTAKELQPITYIFVLLTLRDYELLCRYKMTIDRLSKRPQSRFQKIYSVAERGCKAKECTYLDLTCQIYRYSLGDICSLIRQNKRIDQINPYAFPRCFLGYLRSFLLQAYRSVLDFILDEKNSSLCLSFSFSFDNMLISESHQLLLGNLIHNHAAEPDPLIAYIDEKGDKYIKKRIVDEIKQVMRVSYVQCERSVSYSSDEIYNKLGKQDNERYINASEELSKVQKLIKKYPSQELKQTSLKYLLRIEQELARNKHVLACFYKEQEARNLAQLRRLSPNKCYQMQFQ